MSAPSPSEAADRNLLFGILALQNHFVSDQGLIAGMRAWLLDKGRPLGEILLDQDQLTPERHRLLEALVKEHLQAHNNNAQEGLAALATSRPANVETGQPHDAAGEETNSAQKACFAKVYDELIDLGDSDVQASLVHVATSQRQFASTLLAPAQRREFSAGNSRYEILRPHAKGGLGQVYLARDQELHREVALKEIQSGLADHEESRSRFVLEAEITGALEHPGIVPVYGLGYYADGRPYYAMRFIQGESLRQAIDRFHKADVPGRDAGERSLALRSLLTRFVAVCNAIAYAHSRGIVHRDIKPGNIMLGKFGETIVVDWGLAKVVGRQNAPPESEEMTIRPPSESDLKSTQMGAVIGTPSYMSPEQAAGRWDVVGPASDIYSLGATLYTLLTGKTPFAGADKDDVLEKIKLGAPVAPRQVKSEVPASLEAVCLKAMALAPEARYASPLQLGEDVEHWLADEPIAGYREPWVVRLGRLVRRHRTAAAGLIVLLLTATISLSIGTFLILEEKIKTEKAQAIAKGKETEALAARKQADENYEEAKLREAEAVAARKRADKNYEEAKRREADAVTARREAEHTAEMADAYARFVKRAMHAPDKLLDDASVRALDRAIASEEQALAKKENRERRRFLATLCAQKGHLLYEYMSMIYVSTAPVIPSFRVFYAESSSGNSAMVSLVASANARVPDWVPSHFREADLAFVKALQYYPDPDRTRAELLTWHGFLLTQARSGSDQSTLRKLANEALTIAPEFHGSQFLDGLANYYEATANVYSEAALAAEKKSIDALERAIAAGNQNPPPELLDVYYSYHSGINLLRANTLFALYGGKKRKEYQTCLEDALKDANYVIKKFNPRYEWLPYMQRGNAEEDLAWLCGKEDQYAEALKDFRHAIDTSKGLPQPYTSRGRAFFKRYAYGSKHSVGDLNDARMELGRACKVAEDAKEEGQLTEASLWLARTCLALGKYQEGTDSAAKKRDLYQEAIERLHLAISNASPGALSFASLVVREELSEASRLALVKEDPTVLSAAIREHCASIRAKNAADPDLFAYAVRLACETWILEGNLKRNSNVKEARALYQNALQLCDDQLNNSVVKGLKRCEVLLVRADLILRNPDLSSEDVNKETPSSLQNVREAMQIADENGGKSSRGRARYRFAFYQEALVLYKDKDITHLYEGIDAIKKAVDIDADNVESSKWRLMAANECLLLLKKDAVTPFLEEERRRDLREVGRDYFKSVSEDERASNLDRQAAADGLDQISRR